MQIPVDFPSWIAPVLTAIGSVLIGLVTGLTTYKSQGKQLKNDWEKAQAEMKRAGTEEFEAINAGNRALREALIEQIKAAHDETDRIRREHQECEHKNEIRFRRIRELEEKLSKQGIRIDIIAEIDEES